MKVVLASASPRRQELLRQIGHTPVVRPASFAESGGAASQAHEVALHNAVGKCSAVVAEVGDSLPVIAADTIVVIDNVILGKPQDAADAKAMLMRLAGRTHQVMTGVAVRYRGRQLAEVCVTDVSFRRLTEAQIAAYVATGEPLDKAGAYGIQGKGAVLVEKINGCYSNVVGLPLARLQAMLDELGANGAMTESD